MTSTGSLGNSLHGHPLPPRVRPQPLTFALNRKRIAISPFDASIPYDLTLLEYLREHARLPGTKLGCGEGGCGACTVAILRYKSRATREQEAQSGTGNRLPYEIKAVNACLMPLIAVHGAQVITIEGIGTVANPHAIQQRLAFLFGSQCGFCTPGIIMSFYATLRNAGKRGLSEREIERSMDGNLCRCTGYRPILDALKTFARASGENDTAVETLNAVQEATVCSWENDVMASKRENKEAEPVACPRGEQCCRVQKKKPMTARSTSPDSLESSSSLSSGRDSGFASSSEPPPVSSLQVATKRIGLTDEESGLLSYEASSEPIFPPWLAKESAADPWGRSLYDSQELALVDVAHMHERDLDLDTLDGDNPETPSASKSGTIWLRPTSVASLLDMTSFYRAQGQNVKLRSGDSECRIEVKFLKRKYDVSIFVGALPSLSFIKRTADSLEIGANLPLQDVMSQLRLLLLQEQDDYAKQVYRAILSNASHFASTQIRNVACIGGNIATASPISDLNPVWMALDASVRYVDAASIDKDAAVLEDKDLLATCEKVLPMSTFFKGYRKTALPASGVLTRVSVPLHAVGSRQKRFVRAYKQAKRKDDDIAIVTCCLYVSLEEQDGSWKVENARLAYGGMAPTTVYATSAQDQLRGQTVISGGAVVPQVLNKSLETLSEKDFDLKHGVPGGMAIYRKSLAIGFLAKLFSEIEQAVQADDPSTSVTPSDTVLQAFDQLSISELQRPITRGSQHYENVAVQTKGGSGAATPHLSALKQCTGEAEYVDDIAPVADELAGALVLSTMANARIVSVDASPALSPSGPATHYVSLADVERLGGKNSWCPPAFDDRFFCGDMSEAVGMVIGVILARTRREALDAARMVKVEYESLGEPVLDIDSAIAKESYFAARPAIQQGPSEAFDDWSDCDEVIEGVTRLGGQEHFYLETNAVLVIPGKEDQQLEVWSSTQNPMETQATVADLLNLPANRITARTKRLGGGFGGKESRSCCLAAPIALASYVAGRPVRCMLDRDEDIALSGQRHPFKSTWKLGFMRDGRLKKFDARVWNNGGWSQDLSRAVVERAMTHIDGVYRFEALRVHGWICKTNTVSNTAFRGFGGPQGMMIIEDAIDKAARTIGLRPDKMRLINLSREGDAVHFGQKLLDWNVPQMWQTLLLTSDYEARRAAVDRFNETNRWKKRGVSINGTRFGISFTALHLNQARVLIHIYAHDGSIMLSHGGTEMGQGLNTKVAQICSTELGVPLDKIHIAHTSTREVANAAPTAASAGSDLNGAACKDACDQLNARLAPFRGVDGTVPFEKAVHDAYFARVNLSAVGHYRTDIKGMNWDKGEGEPFAYWTQGVCVSEAEIDVVTGDARIVRTDIIMDIARSINPGIDVGQIEGAVMQGIGLVTTEESLWRADGTLFTKGPGNYKIPAFLDTPADMRVAFMRREDGRKAHYLKTVQGSKGIGEPPLALGAFHFFAIKDAIASARKDAGLGTAPFQLYSPATPERIRLACADPIVRMAEKGAKPLNETDKSFFVTIM